MTNKIYQISEGSLIEIDENRIEILENGDMLIRRENSDKNLCPVCGNRSLYFPDPYCVLMSLPPRRDIRCKSCDYAGAVTLS